MGAVCFSPTLNGQIRIGCCRAIMYADSRTAKRPTVCTSFSFCAALPRAEGDVLLRARRAREEDVVAELTERESISGRPNGGSLALEYENSMAARGQFRPLGHLSSWSRRAAPKTKKRALSRHAIMCVGFSRWK